MEMDLMIRVTVPLGRLLICFAHSSQGHLPAKMRQDFIEFILCSINKIELFSLLKLYFQIVKPSVKCKPRPTVTWWREYSLLDDTYLFIPSDNLVRNELKIAELKRHDLLAVLTCQASNNNITVPASTAVTLDLNLKPVDVRIDPTRQPLSAGQEYEFTCMAAGSRPPAVITWWKSNKQLKNPDDKSTQAGDVTTSFYRFTPTVQDNNVHFSCRAHNPVIPGSAESDGWTLEIHCK
ncbi:uncharacterized protein CEXT_258641 [Caerostris extrusa]|uniref:Ig-like domain-containing protein n=1 Tax=Caerostris extrusa TaxID=172846 RepID=A0AAV4M464_CAEEX|nr:uncharacterized protein CEXT_258641 [Caerostris extrusa]